MSELVILCNEQNIDCDSEDYNCNGSVVVADDEYQTTTFYDVEY